jgi:hypothetical protein
MDPTLLTGITGMLRTLPSAGVTRDLALQRMADVYAADEAMGSLRAAAERARATSGPIADVLAACRWADVPELGTPHERDRRRAAIESPMFLDVIPGWIKELREIAATRSDTGACTVATALQLWLWTITYLRGMDHAPIASAELADAFWPLLAARCRILELIAETTSGTEGQFRADLCHVHAAHAAAAAGTTCAELVFGYRRHLAWDDEGCAACYGADQLDELEGWIPGIASSARAHGDVVEADGSHAAKAGPCAKFDGLSDFTRLRARLDACLTGARRAKDRAAAALPQMLGNGSAAFTS